MDDLQIAGSVVQPTAAVLGDGHDVLDADPEPAGQVDAGLDPVDNVSRLGTHVYFQFADLDMFVTPPVRAAFAAANPAAKMTVYPGSQHFLTQAAQDDRLAWLRSELRL